MPRGARYGRQWPLAGVRSRLAHLNSKEKKKTGFTVITIIINIYPHYLGGT